MLVRHVERTNVKTMTMEHRSLIVLGKKRMEEEAAAAAAGTAAAPADGDAADKDDDERELDKLEKGDPDMLRVCSTIVDQLDTFKVRQRDCVCLELKLTALHEWIDA